MSYRKLRVAMWVLLSIQIGSLTSSAMGLQGANRITTQEGRSLLRKLTQPAASLTQSKLFFPNSWFRYYAETSQQGSSRHPLPPSSKIKQKFHGHRQWKRQYHQSNSNAFQGFAGAGAMTASVAGISFFNKSNERDDKQVAIKSNSDAWSYISSHPTAHNLPNIGRVVTRKALIEGIENRLDNTSEGLNVLLLHGMGGSGKTTLANIYAHRSLDKGIYETAWWIDASTKDSLKIGLIDVAKRLGAKTLGELNTAIESKQLAARVSARMPNSAHVEGVLECVSKREGKNYFDAIQNLEEDVLAELVSAILNEKDNFLLILDNADHPEILKNILKAFRTGDKKGSAIITSRVSKGDKFGESLSRLQVGVFEEEEALNFLSESHPPDSSKDKADMETLAIDRLGCLPLSLEIARVYIERVLDNASNAYTTYLRFHGEDLKKLKTMQRVPSSYKRGLNDDATLSLTLKEVQKQNPTAFKVAEIMAYLSSRDIPTFLFKHHMPSEVERSEAFAVLKEFSIIENGSKKDTHNMHLSLQSNTRNIMPNLNSKLEPPLLGAINSVVNTWKELTELEIEGEIGDIQATKYKDPSIRYQIDRLLPHVDAIWGHVREKKLRCIFSKTATQVEKVLRFMVEVARYHWLSTRDSNRAIICLEEILQKSKETTVFLQGITLDHLKGKALYNLALIYSDIDQEEALNCLEKLKEVSVWNPNYSLTEANILIKKGEFKKAILLLKSIKGDLETEYGQNSAKVAQWHNNIGLAYFGSAYKKEHPTKKHRQEAISHHKQGLEMKINTVGIEHLATGYAHRYLGIAQMCDGDYYNAICNLEAAASIHKLAIGRWNESNVEVAYDLKLIGTAYSLDGKPKEAKEYLEAAKDMLKKTNSNIDASECAWMNQYTKLGDLF